jgi:hypothetical protein
MDFKSFFLILIFSLLANVRSTFAQPCKAVNGHTYYVTSKNSTGSGTLRQAILDANADNTGGNIHSLIFSDTITLNAPLPPI